MTLSTLKPGGSGKIKKIKVNGSMGRRLMDMGLLVGEDVCVKKIAPFGDPIEINIRGYSLYIRKNEAKEILLETDKDCTSHGGKKAIIAALTGKLHNPS